jgi:hypothetical protein
MRSLMRAMGNPAGWLAAAGLLVALACGGQDSGSGAGAGAGGEGAGADAGGGAGQGGELSATAERCLDLVADGRFADAIDPCTRAVRESPASQELADALETAQQGVAAAGKAAAESAKQAAGQAGSEADAARKAAEGLTR